MGIVRGLTWAVLAVAVVYFITLLAVLAFTFLYPNDNHADLRVDAIVCLGAGMDPDGRLHAPAVARVQECGILHAHGVAPIVVFSGGRAVPDGPAAGDQMAALAVLIGMPEAATRSETAAHSTLQNALFSQPFLTDADSIVLVTEAFHLPRSYISFRAMGDHAIHLAMSERVRAIHGQNDLAIILREAAAIWFNLGRYTVWKAAKIFGTDDIDGILH